MNYLYNPSSAELKHFIDNSNKGVWGQYTDKGIAFFLRDEYTIEKVHEFLGTRGDVKPLCIVITKTYSMSYTDAYRGVGVRNIAELAYMYTYLKKYKFLDQDFIHRVYKGIRYVIDLKENKYHPRRVEAVDIIGDHPVVRDVLKKFLKGIKISLKVLMPILSTIGILLLKKKYHIGENKMDNTTLIEALAYYNEVEDKNKVIRKRDYALKGLKIGAGIGSGLGALAYGANLGPRYIVPGAISGAVNHGALGAGIGALVGAYKKRQQNKMVRNG